MSESDPFASAEDDEDEFGEFETADSGDQITMPTFDGSFDFDGNGEGFEDDGPSVFDRSASFEQSDGFEKLAEVVDPTKEHDRPDGLVEVDDRESGSKIIVPRDEVEIAKHSKDVKATH